MWETLQDWRKCYRCNAKFNITGDEINRKQLYQKRMMMLTVTADEVEDITIGVTIVLYRIFRFILFELSRILFSLFLFF